MSADLKMLTRAHTFDVPEAQDGSSSLYSAIAAGYDASYAQPSHRRLYDRMAWELASAVPLPEQAHVVDVGCGTGRWIGRWLKRGCRVTAIERAPGMIEALHAQGYDRHDDRFTLQVSGMEEATLPDASADLVLALGSVQYSRDPAAVIARMARWLKPGGTLLVYVDSLMALVLELLRDGRHEEALERMRTRRGLFRQGEHTASLYLYDRDTLAAHFAAAGLQDIALHGLAVTAGALGRGGCTQAMEADEDATMALEQSLAQSATMADAGLHILATGRRPG